MRITTFEDLTNDIYDDTGILASNIIQETLCWLDQHPKRTPQPTVLESKRDHWIKNQGEDYARGFQAGISALDGRVIPDPAPTNAEKLEKLFTDLMKCQMTYREAAVQLDMLGVKAPEDE